MACARFPPRKSARDASGSSDVIVLHQHGVIEAETVVDAASGPDGIFLQRTESRRRLARTGDARARAFDRLDVGCGQGGYAAQPSEEVERGSLGGEDRAGRS